MFITKKKTRVFIPMKIAICDDNPAFMQQLCQLIRGHSALNDWMCEYSLYQFPEKLLNSDLSGVHVVFLDIDMPGINGIEVASRLRKLYPELIIVFVTAFIEYAPAGYCVEAFRYLLKSSIASELPACLDAIKRKLYDTQESISVQIPNQTIQVQLKEIIYIEGASNRHVFIRLFSRSSENPMECLGKLSDFEHQLSEKGFLRIQRSYLVNMHYINKMSNYYAILCNGESLKVSERNYAQISRQYIMWKGQQL